jgi:hypothetical protein
MKLARVCLFLTGIFFLQPSPAAAQHHDHPEGDPERLGTVNFPISCTAEAQKQFNRAMSVLHSFWYAKAEKEFRMAAEKDPACAMAYWGIAMSQYRVLWEFPGPAELKTGREAIAKAKGLNAKTERERDFIAALDAYFGGPETADAATRAQNYERAMASLHQKYPKDSEAGMFYALTLLRNGLPPDKTYANQKKAGAIAEIAFRAQPDHPGAAHYVIHSYDYPPLADRALGAARRYAKIAPDSPHALHMPSHIFTRMGLWDESIRSNADSAAAGRKYDWPGEELHAMDYLMYAHLQRGEDGKAGALLASPPSVKLGDPSAFAGFFARAAMPARYALERNQWKEAASLEPPPNLFPGGRYAWTEATFTFARGLGAARSGQVAKAREVIGQLESAHKALLDNKEPYWANQVDIQRQIVTAWLAFAEGKNEEAVAKMRAAADAEDATDKHPVTPGAIRPARELLGDMLVEMKRGAEALPEFEAVLKAAPRRLNALYGAGRSAELAGNTAKAGEYYAMLVDLTRDGDGTRAELAAAREFLSKHPKAQASRE